MDETGDKAAILTTATYPWSFPDFRAFWPARFATMLGQSCTVLAVAWQVYDVSRLSMGALACALLLMLRPLRGRVGAVMLIAVMVYGAATIGFGFSRWLPLSLLCLVVLGAADMTSDIRQSIIQLTTPNAMRGRVGALGTLSVSASNELGEMESGVLGALLGPVGAVVAGGIGSILVVIAWNRWFPELRAQHELVPGSE